MKYTIYILLLLVFHTSCSNEAEKTGFIELGNLYNDFDLKKELESKLKMVESSRNNVLDSLELELNIEMKRLESAKEPNQQEINLFQLKQQEYLMKKEQFQNEVTNLTNAYTEQIWTQINKYVEEYGKEKEYTYIHGADGSGTVMYAKEEKNITKDVSSYINEKYKGK